MSDLQRFLDAQTGVYDSALAELISGRKRGHWMWFIFPQLRGLGSSPMAQAYAIESSDEAAAFLAHPVLGRRLLECTHAVNALDGPTVAEIFGYPDHLKFRSCLTLFETVGIEASVFTSALEKYYDGERDRLTLAILDRIL